MPLKHETVKSNEVRAPSVPRGTAVIVARYRDDNRRVALVNPDDLDMLEACHDAVQAIGELDPLPISDLTVEGQQLEDQPAEQGPVEDPDEIAAILDL